MPVVEFAHIHRRFLTQTRSQTQFVQATWAVTNALDLGRAMTVRASCEAPFYRRTEYTQTVVCTGGRASSPNLERRSLCRQGRGVNRHRPMRQAAVSRPSGIFLAICGMISRGLGPKSELRTASCVEFARARTRGIVHHARTLPRPDHVRKPAWRTD